MNTLVSSPKYPLPSNLHTTVATAAALLFSGSLYGQTTTSHRYMYAHCPFLWGLRHIVVPKWNWSGFQENNKYLLSKLVCFQFVWQKKEVESLNNFVSFRSNMMELSIILVPMSIRKAGLRDPGVQPKPIGNSILIYYYYFFSND